MARRKTFTHPFQHADQQKTKTTKIKQRKELDHDEELYLREEIAEYCATSKSSHVKVS